MKTVDKVFLATSGLLGSLARFPDTPDGEQNAWQDCYFVVTEAKLMVLKPPDKFYSPLNRPHPVEMEISLNMVNSAFLSRPGWETHIESESDDFFYMLPKDVAEILVIVEARTKARILIGLHKKDAAKSFHRAIVAAKAVQNMLVREPGGLVGMLQREPVAASNIKLKIYGWVQITTDSIPFVSVA